MTVGVTGPNPVRRREHEKGLGLHVSHPFPVQDLFPLTYNRLKILFPNTPPSSPTVNWTWNVLLISTWSISSSRYFIHVSVSQFSKGHGPLIKSTGLIPNILLSQPYSGLFLHTVLRFTIFRKIRYDSLKNRKILTSLVSFENCTNLLPIETQILPSRLLFHLLFKLTSPRPKQSFSSLRHPGTTTWDQRSKFYRRVPWTDS